MFLIVACANDQKQPMVSGDEAAIKKIRDQYVSSWLANDEQGVLSLFLENSRIQPSSLCPIDSMKNIRQFWFPHDKSKTTIDHFQINDFCIHVDGDTAVSTGVSYLDWSYQNDTTAFSVSQKGIETTVYLRQADKSWKIWRQMWTDLYARRKNK